LHQQAIQSGLVEQWAGEGGFTIGIVGDGQLAKGWNPVVGQVTFDTDLIASGLTRLEHNRSPKVTRNYAPF
jgi:hypothetical protein